MGLCSRTQAALWIRDGRVRVNGRVADDAEMAVDTSRDRVEVDRVEATPAKRIYLAFNKPRGYVTTAADERGRDTVYALLAGSGLPWVAPVGRLDRASEGLLLFTNDSAWAARITAPGSQLDKTYHVQIDRLPGDGLLDALCVGVDDRGERLAAKSALELRRGERNAWLEIVLDEGRNRHIRRLLDAFEIGVARLVRVSIGSLVLGEMGKGSWRHLTDDDVAALAAPSPCDVDR